MEIGFYHDKAGAKDTGGISLYIQQLANSLADPHRIHVFNYNTDGMTDTIKSTYVNLYNLNNTNISGTISKFAESTTGSKSFGEKVAMLYREIQEKQFTGICEELDVILTHQWFDDIVASRLSNAPTIYQYHSAPTNGGGVGERLRNHFSSSRYHLANSRYTAKSVEENVDIEIDGIVYPGINQSSFNSVNSTKRLEMNKPVILFVGRLVANKGLFKCIEAVAQCDHDCCLRIVGGGDQQKVTDMAQECNILEDIEILGPVPHTELPEIYNSADVFCMPSSFETFGMANVESMACGTPVITTDAGGISEYAVHEKNAIVLNEHTASNISDAISLVLSSPDLQERLVSAGIETSKCFSWSTSAKMIERHCEYAIKSSQN
jgi:glycosyltransferase involved in cell wall biosynthesis